MYARCPQCAQPAQIIDRFSLGSTDGPLEHVKLSCRNGHWFTPRAEDVEIMQVAPSGEPMEAGPAGQAAA
jgi:hypothetical protein